jgi:leader peptidase (prepilin peptidase)/N-methyltransferase
VGAAVVDATHHAECGARRRTTPATIGRAWRDVGTTGAALAVVAVAACGVVTASWMAETARALATGAAIAVLVAAALVDAAEHRLPNVLVGLAAVPVLLAVALGPTVMVVTGAAIVGVPLLATHLLAPDGMGFGDVKAGVVLGAALALVDTQLAVLGLVLGLAAGAAWGLVRRARTVPLGPALVGGAIAALAAGRLLGLEAG